MKKHISILLFLALVAPYFISYVWLLSFKQSLKSDVKREISSGKTGSNMIWLSFTVKESEEKLHWEKPDEFEFGGQMYDVVRTQTDGDTVRFWCYPDKKETSLNARIKNVVAKAFGQNPQSTENQKRLHSLLHSLYLQDHFSWNPEVPGQAVYLLSSQGFPCLSPQFEPLVPPPRIG